MRAPIRNICSWPNMRSAVEQILVGARLRQRARQLGARACRRPAARRRTPARSARPSPADARARMSASRGAVPSIEREQRDEIRILPQQREQPRAAVQAGEEAVERDQRARRDFPRAPDWSSSTGTSSASCVRANSLLQRAVFARRASARTAADTSSGRRKPIAASLSSVAVVVLVGRKDERAARGLGARARPRTAAHSAAAPCADARAALPRRRRGRRSRGSARSARALRDRPAACGSARRRPSAGGARSTRRKR